MTVTNIKVKIKQGLKDYKENKKQRENGTIGLKPLYIVSDLDYIGNSRVKLFSINILSYIRK